MTGSPPRIRQGAPRAHSPASARGSQDVDTVGYRWISRVIALVVLSACWWWSTRQVTTRTGEGWRMIAGRGTPVGSGKKEPALAGAVRKSGPLSQLATAIMVPQTGGGRGKGARAEGESVHAQPAGESPLGAAACSGKVADDAKAPPGSTLQPAAPLLPPSPACATVAPQWTWDATLHGEDRSNGLERTCEW